MTEDSKSNKGVIIGLIILLAAIVGIVALTQADPEPIQEAASETSADEVELVPLEVVDNTYNVDTVDSEVTWEGRKALGAHNGTLELSSGSLVVVDGEIVDGEIAFDLSTITTVDDGSGNDDVDTHLKSADFFDVANNPEATFVISEVKSLGGDQYQVTGDLTIRGTTETVVFPATITANDNQITANAVIEIDRATYEIGTDSKLADIALTDTFTLEVMLVTSSN